MSAPQAGYVLVAVVWVVILIPVISSAVRFFRTTKLADLVPRIRRIRKRTPMTVVSGQRASYDPAHFEQFTPWSWEETSVNGIQSLLIGWLMVFLPLGALGLIAWALWRLVPRLRKSMGYGNSHRRQFSK